MTDQHSESPAEHWNMLGETELPTTSSTDRLMRSWLTATLSPLSLNEDFLNKILRSAEDSVGRALQQNAGMGIGHIHLSIFAPYENTFKENTWGFFRIEKIDSTETNQGHLDHNVEFYLYVEGR